MTPELQQLLDRRPSVKLRLGLWLVFLAVGLGIFWASQTTLPRVVRAPIIIQPAGDVQRVQHPDGGRLSELLVQTGERVAQGQVLLRIDRTRAESNLGENRARARSLERRLARLRVEVTGQRFVSTAPNLDEQVAVSAARFAAIEQEQQVLADRIQAVESQREANRRAIRAAQDQVASARSEYEQFLTLLNSGAVSRVEVLRLERELRERRSALEQLQTETSRLSSERDVLVEQQQSLLADFVARAQEELIATETELEALENLASGMSDLVQATEVVAPTDGVLGEIYVNTLGQAIQPGDVLMEIVPENDVLTAAAELSPIDIGFVTPGQPVRIRISTFDFARYGVLEGRVERVGVNTVEERDKEPYYPSKIALSAAFLGDSESGLEIKVGMRGTADIITGERTVLDYFLTPFEKVKFEAFTER